MASGKGERNRSFVYINRSCSNAKVRWDWKMYAEDDLKLLKLKASPTRSLNVYNMHQYASNMRQDCVNTSNCVDNTFKTHLIMHQMHRNVSKLRQICVFCVGYFTHLRTW
jgi:hypothetical protein